MSKPFIKLFCTPRGYYFFDVNRNQIKEISRTSYLQLQNCMSDNEAQHANSELHQLQEEGFLSEHRPQKMEHGLSSIAPQIIDNHMYQIVLQVTQACNLTCIYCPYANKSTHQLSRHHSNAVMTHDIAKQALDFLAQHSTESKEIFVTFYGGEPIIAFDLIKWCVDYSRKLFADKKLSFFITTNATLLTDEMIDYLAANRFMITFSMDGPREIHDRHRITSTGEPTYDKVISKLKRTIAAYGPELHGEISINIVINPSDPLDRIMDWLMDPLFKKVVVRASLVENDMIERKFDSYGKYNEKFSYMLAEAMMDYLQIVKGLRVNPIAESAAQSYIDEYGALFSNHEPLEDITAPSGPCIPGGKKLFVSTDGSFFPCEKVNELSDAMKVGSLSSGIQMSKVLAQLNLSQLTENTCRNCWAIHHCTVCQRNADGNNTLNGEIKKQHCSESIATFGRIVKMNLLIQEYKTKYKYRTAYADRLFDHNDTTLVCKELHERCDAFTNQEAVIVAVGSLLKGMNTAAIINRLYRRFTQRGYKVSVVTTSQSQCDQNDAVRMPIDNFITRDTDNSVVLVNEFMNLHQVCYHSDIILLQMPDEGFIRLTDAVETGFGVKTFIISQAVSIDYTLMCSPLLGMSNTEYEDLSIKTLSRFGFNLDAICLAPKVINYVQQASQSELSYLNTPHDVFDEELKILCEQNNGNILFGSEDGSWVENLADRMIESLST